MARKPPEGRTWSGEEEPEGSHTTQFTAASQVRRYRQMGDIGSGGMGDVRRVHDVHLDRVVAMKTLRPEGALLAGWRARFEREARLTARLQHPGVVPVHELGEQDGHAWFTMKEVRGQTLADVIADVHAPSFAKGGSEFEVICDLRSGV